MSRLACCRCNSDSSSCCSFARVLCAVCVSRNPPQDRCDIFKMNLNCAIFNHFENENTNSSRAMQPKWNQSNPMANNNWRRFGMPATRCWCTQRSSSRMYMIFLFLYLPFNVPIFIPHSFDCKTLVIDTMNPPCSSRCASAHQLPHQIWSNFQSFISSHSVGFSDSEWIDTEVINRMGLAVGKWLTILVHRAPSWMSDWVRGGNLRETLLRSHRYIIIDLFCFFFSLHTKCFDALEKLQSIRFMISCHKINIIRNVSLTQPAQFTLRSADAGAAHRFIIINVFWGFCCCSANIWLTVGAYNFFLFTVVVFHVIWTRDDDAKLRNFFIFFFLQNSYCFCVFHVLIWTEASEMKIATDLTPIGKFVWMCNSAICMWILCVFWIIKDHRRLVGQTHSTVRGCSTMKNLNKTTMGWMNNFENCNQIANSPSCSLSYLIFIAFFSLTLDEGSLHHPLARMCLSNWRRLRLHFSIRSHLYIFMVILPSTVRWISSANSASANESTRSLAQHTLLCIHIHTVQLLSIHPFDRKLVLFLHSNLLYSKIYTMIFIWLFCFVCFFSFSRLFRSLGPLETLPREMVSRRKILSRSRDDLNLEHHHQYVTQDDEEDIWYQKDKLYKVSFSIIFHFQNANTNRVCVAISMEINFPIGVCASVGLLSNRTDFVNSWPHLIAPFTFGSWANATNGKSLV